MGKKPKASKPDAAPTDEPAPQLAAEAEETFDLDAAPPARRGMKAFLPEGNLLPWWVVLLLTCYVLLKIGLSIEHPCSILGVSAPVTRGAISKRYREVSMCTHPDKLLGSSAADVLRGKLLFQRASSARDELLVAQRDAAALLERQQQLLAGAAAGGSTEDGAAADSSVAQASCSTELDDAIFQTVAYLFDAGRTVGITAMAQYVFDFFYALCTFQYDMTGTVSSLLLLMTLFRTLAGFLGFLRTSGPISTLISAVATTIIGPLPTLLRLVALPLLRVEAFVRWELLPFFSADADGDADNDVEIDGGPAGSADDLAYEASMMARAEGAADAADAAEPPPADAADAAAEAEADATTELAAAEAAALKKAKARLPQRDGETPKRGLRQRAKAAKAAEERAPTKAQVHQHNALRRMEQSMKEAYRVPVLLQPLRELLARRADPNSRAYAAGAVQFELLLSTTKPIIPLCCLLATGQVYNGVFFSIATAQVLNRAPALRPETQHLLVLAVGALHTLVCAGKRELMEMEKAPEGLLQLQWDWGMRDVFAIANMLMIGGSFSCASAAFNEPTFCASFAAGLALRIVLYELTPPAVGERVRALLRAQNLEFVGLDLVGARAGGKIGSCGGGPLRAALGGWGVPALPQLAALACKGALLLLPALAAAQWGLRAAKAAQRLRRETARQGGARRIKISGELLAPVLRRRCAAAAVMHVAMLLLCGLVAGYELNGVNSQLGTMLVLACAGCVLESLVCSYDMRGRMRQFLFFVLFMVL